MCYELYHRSETASIKTLLPATGRILIARMPTDHIANALLQKVFELHACALDSFPLPTSNKLLQRKKQKTPSASEVIETRHDIAN
jgi:hypothetical protein